MLAIRMQRVGRTGYAQYRIIVQESQRSPKSGRVVANLGHYNPHSKEITLDKEQAAQFLQNGARPSDSVIRVLKAQGVKLPDWVTPQKTEVKRATKNPEKLRKNQPKEVEAPAEAEAKSETTEDAAAAEPEAATEDEKTSK